MIKNKKILVVLVLLITIIALFISNKSKLLVLKDESCKNPTKYEDYLTKDKRLLICKDTIKYGNTIVAKKEELPDLFVYKFNDNEDWAATYEAVAYKIQNDEYIAIFPVINPQSWYKRSGYVFQKEDNSYKLIFERNFDSLEGRWTGVRFDENGSVFDPSVIVVNQDLGALGYDGQRIRWTDFYEWNANKKTYDLANNKMGYRMKDIIEASDEIDGTACGIESASMKGKKISDLYAIKKENDHFCDDNSPVPYITNGQATLFLKTRKALIENTQGKNYSFNDIDSIEL